MSYGFQTKECRNVREISIWNKIAENLSFFIFHISDEDTSIFQYLLSNTNPNNRRVEGLLQYSIPTFQCLKQKSIYRYLSIHF